MTEREYNICVDKYADNVFRFILKSINDEDKSKDIIQDTFEKLWVKHMDVSFVKAKSYLFSSAYHTMIDYIRKEKKVSRFDIVNTEDYGYNIDNIDVQEILHNAIRKLPEDQRSVILLRDYEGYSYKEIEELTGLKEAQVKVYIYRARVFLKNYLGSIEAII